MGIICILFLSVSCKTDDNTKSKSDLNSNLCSSNFDKSFPISDIRNGESLYVDMTNFEFLNQSGIVFESIFLQLTLDGKNDGKNIELSSNGRKLSRKDGGAGGQLLRSWTELSTLSNNQSKSQVENSKSESEHDDSEKDSEDQKNQKPKAIVLDRSQLLVPLHLTLLNGGESFDHFLVNVKRNHGQLRLALQNKVLNVVDASLILKGSIYKPCDPTLPPAPPPPPVAPPPVIPVATIDSTLPNVTPTASASISINFSSNVSGSSYQCSLDKAVAVPCTSPQSYSNLSNGSHSFVVSAVNSLGQAGVAAAYSWVVDTTPPSVSISNLSALQTLTNSTSMSFQFTASEAGTFKCSLDGAAAMVCSSPQLYSSLTEGLHSFSVTAVDNAGNVSLNPASFQWTIDITPPVASIISAAPSAAINNSTSMLLAFSANESSSFQCSIDHAAYGTCSSPISLNNLSDGSHWFSVQATDLAGNVGLPVSYSWSVDLTPPVLQVGTVTPASGSISNAQGVSFGFITNEPSVVTCSLDGAIASVCTSPYLQASLSEGLHTMTLLATDLAGNTSVPVGLSWTLDRTAPVISFGIISPAGAYINSANISFDVIGAAGANLSALLNGVSLGQTISPIAFSNLAQGNYTLIVSATDLAGNVSNTLNYSFTVDLTPPSISLAASNSSAVTNIDNNTFSFVASEASTFQCQLDAAGFAPCQSPIAYSGLANGVHQFSVQATDLAGNVSTISSYSWTIDRAPPVVTNLAYSVTTNSITITWNTDKAATSLGVYGLGAALNLQTAEDLTLVTNHSLTISGLTANSTYSVQVGGKDSSGNSYLSVVTLVRTRR